MKLKINKPKSSYLKYKNMSNVFFKLFSNKFPLQITIKWKKKKIRTIVSYFKQNQKKLNKKRIYEYFINQFAISSKYRKRKKPKQSNNLMKK